jgi:hypothetical protein
MSNAIDMARPANDSAKNIDGALAAYVAHIAATHPLFPASKGYAHGVDLGPRFARVWKRLGTQDSRSVVCFVDLATGAIHGAKSWKAAGPATGKFIALAGA